MEAAILWIMKLRLDLLEHLTDEDIMEEPLQYFPLLFPISCS